MGTFFLLFCYCHVISSFHLQPVSVCQPFALTLISTMLYKILMAIATSFTPSIMIAAEYNLFLASSLDLCFSEVLSLDVFHDELQAKHPPHSLVFSRISSLHMGNYEPKILTRRPANQSFCTQTTCSIPHTSFLPIYRSPLHLALMLLGGCST